MIALLIIVYCAVVLVLFKVFHLKPRPYLIACMALAGVLMIGGVVVAWTQSAPLTGQLVTTQYVIQLVPYVKGQVKAVHAEANQPVKKGDLLLEIDPAPYQYTVDQLEAQLKVSKANVEQAQAGAQAADANVTKAKDGVTQGQAAVDQAKAGVANAQANLSKAKAGDDLAKTQEQIALNIQRADVAAISQLKVAEAKQQRQEADAAVQQADAAVTQAQAAEHMRWPHQPLRSLRCSRPRPPRVKRALPWQWPRTAYPLWRLNWETRASTSRSAGCRATDMW